MRRGKLNSFLSNMATGWYALLTHVLLLLLTISGRSAVDVGAVDTTSVSEFETLLSSAIKQPNAVVHVLSESVIVLVRRVHNTLVYFHVAAAAVAGNSRSL